MMKIPSKEKNYGSIRLCIVNTMYLENTRKISGVVREEALKLKPYFEQIHVILFHKFSRTFKLQDNIFFHTVPIKPRRNLALFILSSLVSYFFLYFLVIQVISRHRVNVVRADDVLKTGIPATMASKMMETPVIVFVAGSEEDLVNIKFHRSKIILKFSHILERVVMRLSDQILAVTSPLIDRCREKGARNVLWSPTFLNIGKFRPRKYLRLHSKIRVLYVGRLETEKGVETLLESAWLLKGENVEFILAGDGSLRKRLRSIIETRGLSTMIQVLGNMSHDEMPKVYQEADILVLPSYTEGIPVAVLEAASCNMPVIVTPVGIIPYIFKNNVHALIVPPGKPRVLANAITRMMNEPDLRVRLAQNARAVVLNKFNSYIPKHIEVYRRLALKNEEVT